MLIGQQSGATSAAGHAMAALVVALSVMSILMSAALPVYTTMARREKELEPIFRGQQYARAVTLYQRKYPHVYPRSIELLVERRFLRKAYGDPISNNEPFVVIRSGTTRPDLTNDAGRIEAGIYGDSPMFGGVSGVVSQSKARSIIEFRGRRHYNEWTFVVTPSSLKPTARVVQ